MAKATTTVMPTLVKDVMAERQESRHQDGAHPGFRYTIGKQQRRVIDTVVREDNGDLLVVYLIEATGESYACDLADWKQLVDSARLEVDSWSERPRPGTTWKHFKGHVYRIVTNAFYVNTGEHLVIYKDAEKNYVWAREIASWLTSLAINGKSVPRFALVQ